MFKVKLYKTFLDKEMNSTNKKRIKGITIYTGYECRCSIECPNYRNCKYKAKHHNSKLSELRFNIVNYFRYHCKLFKIPNLSYAGPIFFGKFNRDLSGTSMCPYKMDRIKSCLYCKYSYIGGDDGIHFCCSNKEYAETEYKDCNTITKDGVKECKFFEWCDYFKNWDETGNPISN